MYSLLHKCRLNTSVPLYPDIPYMTIYRTVYPGSSYAAVLNSTLQKPCYMSLYNASVANLQQ